jgi:hypothetical protein
MNEKVKSSKPAKGWTAVKQHIKGWDAAQFTELLKDFYNLSAENRTFLDARVQLKSSDDSALETYLSIPNSVSGWQKWRTSPAESAGDLAISLVVRSQN